MPRQDRSVSAQATRNPPQGAGTPARTQRSTSDFRDSGVREPVRTLRASDSGLAAPLPRMSNTPSYAPLTSPPLPNSRAASSQYGGIQERQFANHDAMRSPSSVRPQQRSISGSTDERPRRGAVPFASPPITGEAFRTAPTTRPVETVRALDITPKTEPLEVRPSRPNLDHLATPLTFNDHRSTQTPPLERPPEKSLRRQALESPASEMAPALRNNEYPPLQSPMSPPPPAKSPARRPSNIRTTSNGSAKALHDRLNGSVSPALSGPTTPVPEIPSLPVKSVARPPDSTRGERLGLPWQSPPGTQINGEKVHTDTNILPEERSIGLSKVQESDKQQFLEHVSQEPQFEANMPKDSATMIGQTTEDNPTSETAPDTKSEDGALDDETFYIDEAIRDFKWTAHAGVDSLAARLQDELAMLESSNIHTMVESDERMDDLMAKLDRGILQCDDMANLLTIYEFELGTVSDHIKHIESQSQGLQVETANQKSLVEEISRVLSSITISESDLDILKGRGGNLESNEGLENIERSLVNLYRALKSMRDETTHDTDRGMSAMRSKNTEYIQESSAFLARLSQYLQIKFQAALLPKEVLSVSKTDPSRVLDGHENGFMMLVPYASLILYSRQIDPNRHAEYMRTYAAAAKGSWHDAILNFAGQWREQARKATPEENDMIFTTAKDQQALGNARNATLKRSNTLAKQIKAVAAPKTDKDVGDSKLPASEVFRIILDNLALLLANEQNFLVSFFHLSSFGAYEYPDYVELDGKSRITIESLDDHKPTEPNRTLAKERYILMESIFGWLNNDLSSLVDHFAKLDPIQVIGVIKSIEVVVVEWADSDQEFMLKTLQKLKDRSMGLLSRFIENQVKAIKNIKITSKKRKGIIPVFEIFPEFVERIELQLRSTESGQVSTNQLDIRETVNEAYEQMSKAMFDSVKTLASSASMSSQGLVDPEDKEALNYHILMVQNMHQYLEALQSRNNVILEDFQFSAQKQYSQHLLSYTRQLINRPVGRLIDFIDAFEKSKQREEDTSAKALFSQTSLKRLLADHDERDMRKGISAMWKRVDKHFGDDDGAGTSGLLLVVWKATQQEYMSIIDGLLATLQAHYPEIRVDWTRQSLTTAFTKREL